VDCSSLPNIGPATALRPGSGWHCVFTSGVLARFPANTTMGCERQGVRYFTIANKTWASEFTPQQLYDKLRAAGHQPVWIEVWENPPTLGVIGNDDFAFIALYKE